MIMNPFTKKVLWDFWNMSNDYEGVANEENSDVKEANNDDEQETIEIFKIETNLFYYETPLCTEFKEFNFLLKIDQELFTYDIERTMDCEDYENRLNDEPEEPWSKNDVPYKIGDHICEPFYFKNKETKWPTCSSNEDGFCNGGELSGMNTFRNFHKLDYELLEKLQNYWWKVNNHECSPFTNWRNYIRGPYANYYSNFLVMMEHEDEERHELCDDATQKRSVCNIRRFEMIKYSFNDDEEYVAVKENEYDDLTSTSEDACRTYQEIFRMMDEGWMVTRAE
ncbi:hypothetical protein Tco_1411770 [Tanacetum coccineum]